jgi:hypothetical protein
MPAISAISIDDEISQCLSASEWVCARLGIVSYLPSYPRVTRPIFGLDLDLGLEPSDSDSDDDKLLHAHVRTTAASAPQY